MPGQRRGKYRQPSDEERRAIIDAHVAGDDYVAVAARLRIKRGTAWSIVARYLRTGEVVCEQRGGAQHHRLDDESKDLLVMCLEDSPQLTLRQLALILQQTWPDKPTVSTTTISRALHGECISMKKVVPQPAERNSERVKEERCNFSAWMMTTGLDRHRIYVDESGFNLHLMRTRGRAPVGDRAVRTVCGSRGRNVTFITAISDRHEDGVIYHEMVDGGVGKQRFADFLQSLSTVIGEDEEVTILFDNAPSHQGVEDAVILPRTHQLQRLPPYSPFLNPIENVFSVLKAHVKQHMAAHQPVLDDRVSAAREGMSLEAWRRQILFNGISMALQSVTGDQVTAQYRHSNTFLPACAAKENILG